MPKLGRSILAFVAVTSSIGGFIADWNDTHVYNPRWPPHAKFHNGQTMSMGLIVGIGGLYYLYRPNASNAVEKESLYMAAFLTSLTWVTQLSAALYPGSLPMDPEFGDGFPQAYFCTVLLSMVAIGTALESARLKNWEWHSTSLANDNSRFTSPKIQSTLILAHAVYPPMLMDRHIEFYIFGDQSEKIDEGLCTLICSERDAILDSFLTKSYEAIRSEIQESKLEVPFKFASLLDLLALRKDGLKSVPLDHALTFVYQIGLFIRTCHKLGHYPQAPSSYLAGICTGTLAAAAVSYSQSLFELVPVAIQVLIISFRAGVLAVEVKTHVSLDDNTGASWAVLYPELTIEKANSCIKSFSQSHRVPLISRPYVSSSSNRGVTISGPPELLRVFKKHRDVSAYRGIELSINAPYHASHLYTTQDIECLLNLGPAHPWLDTRRSIPILSIATGEIIDTRVLRDMLQNALTDIFLRPMQWDLLASALDSLLQPSKNTKTLLIPISTDVGPGTKAVLKMKGNTNIEIAAHPLLSASDKNLFDAGRHKTYSSAAGNLPRSKIAIIGMSGRFPGANDTAKFWDILHDGLDVHEVVPPLRWDPKTHVDLSGTSKNTSATPYGCWLEDPGLFDARFFGMSPREAQQVDPAQRLALMTAYEALEQAGVVPDGTPSTKRDRVGVFYGVTSNDWMETNSAQDIDTYFIPGGNRAFIPGRINYCFKFSGPSYSVDTACSSSLAAIHLACNSLWQGDIDTAIAGGTNVLTNPDMTSGLDRGHFLSRTGNCKTFDDSADGYCRGEGVATVILKRLEDALADNDPIQGVILNVSTNHSAESNSITRPNVGAQKDMFQKVLGGTNLSGVSYVEMHGTGTQTGDVAEMSSVLECFAAKVGQRPEYRPLYLGSAKANVGHGEAAAGVTSLIKVLLMMRHDTIPPHCGIKTVTNRKFPEDLFSRGIRIANKPIKWKQEQDVPRRTLINNFSAAGGNTALLLEDPPLTVADSEIDTRTTHIVTVTAKTASALKANAQALLLFLTHTPSSSFTLPSLSYTTTARRTHHPHRIAISGCDVDEIAGNLSKAIISEVGKTRSISSPSIVFIFTGQGSSYIGMGKELFDSISSFRADIYRYDKLTQTQGFPSILPNFTMDKNSIQISDQSPTAVQLTLICLQMALVRLWASWGVTPSSVVGHSLGHYAALNTAGVITAAETIYLVGMRAQELEKSCVSYTHLMLAVKSSFDILSPSLKDRQVEIACINGPSDIVLSGTREDIESLSEVLKSHKIMSTILKTSYAFHSSQMNNVLEGFTQGAQGVSFHPPAIPVICSLSAAVVRLPGAFGPEHLADHCRRPVDLVGALAAASKESVITDNTIFIEIGPHPTVSRMVKSIVSHRSTVLPSLKRDTETWKTLSDALSSLYLGGAEIRWKEFHRDFPSCQKVVELPAYQWDLKDYWIKYVNDWSLRKGDPISFLDAGQHRHVEILSTTIHKVVSEYMRDQSGSITVESDIHRSDLYPLVQGHKVNGIPLCTPSVYADIGLSIGRYLLSKYRPAMEEQQIDISNMVIEKALIAQSQGPQLLHTSVDIDWHQKSAKCQFSTVDKNEKPIVVHAKCTILFTPRPDPQLLEDSGLEYELRIKQLEAGLAEDVCYKFNKTMIYRMVDTLAEFDAAYRALSEVVLNSASMEAGSKVDLRVVKDTESNIFHTHPAYIDSFSQCAGFVMNANDQSDPTSEVFVNHGWGSFKLFERLIPDKVYRTFVKMVKTQGSIWEGNVMILDGNRIVGKFEKIQLQGVPKRLLHSILLSASRQQSQEDTSKYSTKRPTSMDQATPSIPSPRAGDIMTNTNIDSHSRQIEAKSIVTEKVMIDKYNKLMEIVSEETGIDIHELNDETDFVTIGVDSLLSIIITSRLDEELDFNTHFGLSLFDQFFTVGELKSGLARSMGLSPGTRSSTSSSAHGDTPATLHSPTMTETQFASPSFSIETSSQSSLALDDGEMIENAHVRQPTSVVLQKAHTSSNVRTLFLFPDGSGSAYSYASIPRINGDLTVVALISAYMREPEEMKCSFDELVTSFLVEIKRRQPSGPYNLGGWSSGGIFAYRATQRLIEEGQRVDTLVIIDSPEPKGMDRLPQRFYDHCSAIGIFGQIKTDGSSVSVPPKWLIPHFNATIDVLHEYWAEPLPVGLTPKTSIIWARQCTLDGIKHPKLPPSADDTEGMKFLTEERTDFSAGGWADLFPGAKIDVHVVEGANHFSMMNNEYASSLASFIRSATSK
ncbi:PksA [Sclerotinia borealis F-4128]|uniref:PksA n=1 Tax=Sclerotinia borealis (strain F-4128) TaxID=1432307 RepID=W9CTS2_SCLBF|nr:PksA [Sclerotinia borealis F-4128]